MQVRSFLSIHVNFWYSLCFFPYKVILQEDGFWELHTNFVHKIFCTLFYCLGLISKFANFRKLIPNETNVNNPVTYFKFVSYTFALIFQGLTINQIWRDQRSTVNILNFVSNHHNNQLRFPFRRHNLRIIENPLAIKILLILYVIIPLCDTIRSKILAPVNKWNETVWNTGGLISEGRYMLFLGKGSSSLSKSHHHEGFPWVDLGVALLAATAFVARSFLSFCFDVGLLFAVLTVWVECYSLSSEIREELDMLEAQSLFVKSLPPSPSPKQQQSLFLRRRKLQWSEIYQEFLQIRRLCDLVNGAYGMSILFLAANYLVEDSLSLDTLFQVSSLYSRYTVNFLHSIVTFTLAADSSHQLNSINLWISDDKNRQKIPPSQLNIVCKELQAKLVGVRAADIFTFNYSILWNMLSTTLTYFVIILQSRRT